ncbi:MAG: hypothetical protein M1136_03635 [Chloroflexi bacterium]|nr:hypothetical protein [Chloroflexota bacterium]MCL5074732.1 hypothetical protein [Chloroflexota bacterium]
MAVFLYALRRWQTLTALLITFLGLMVTLFFFQRNLICLTTLLIFGTIAVGLMLFDSFKSTERMREALSAGIDLSQLRTRRMRQTIDRALSYQTAIRRAIRQVTSPELQSTLAAITSQMDESVAAIFGLVKRLESYQTDTLLQGDRERLHLEARIRGQEELTAAQEQQLADLDKLDSLMKDIAASIETTLAQMSSLYSNVQLVIANRDLKGDRIRQATAELQERASQLRDLSSALDEVYSRRTQGMLG